MNSQNKRYFYDIANKEDSKELLNILEEDYFKGNISLLYTRRPDAFESFKKEGEEVKIIVLRDRIKNRIAGFGVCALRKLFINQKPENTVYLFALRGSKEYRGKVPLLHKGYKYIKDLFPDVRYFYTTILEENAYAIRLLEKKRKYMPEYKYIGNYIVYSLKTKKDNLYNSKIKRCEVEDIDALVEFMNKEGKNYQFFPFFEKEKIKRGEFFGLKYDDFYIYYQKGKIKASFAIWDQQDYKQYIMMEYNGILKFLYPFSKTIEFFGYPKLPSKGKRLNFFYLSFLMIKDKEEAIFEEILRFARNFNRNYTFFTIGFFENDEYNKVMRRYKSIKYKSRLYLVKWEDFYLNKNLNIQLECGLL